MKQHFGTMVVSALAALWAVGALAAPIRAPGVYMEFKYRYEFDVVSSDIYWPENSIYDDNDERVEDPVLAQTVGDLIHPLRAGLGQTGRVVIEMTKVIEYFESPWVPFPYLDDYEWLEVDCISGFLCDLGRIHPRIDFFSSHFSLSATGFHLYQDSEDWYADFYGNGGGTIRFGGDELGDGSEQVVIDGIKYHASADSQALFQLANVSVTQLYPSPVPLPASALMLLTALGGGALLARRRRRRGTARRKNRL